MGVMFGANAGDVADVLEADAVVVTHIVGTDVAPVDSSDDAEHPVVEADVAEVDRQEAASGRPPGRVQQRRVFLPRAAAVRAAYAERLEVLRFPQMKVDLLVRIVR